MTVPYHRGILIEYIIGVVLTRQELCCTNGVVWIDVEYPTTYAV